MRQSLYKFFYANPRDYQEEYQKRFNGQDTVHLDINIGEYPAFICMTDEIYKRIISIERTDKIINNLCRELPGVAITQFANRCLIDEILLTSDIEGVYSTRKDIGIILQDLSKKDKKSRFVGLVKKYLLLNIDEDIQIDSCDDIRTLYDDIFYEEINAHAPENLPDGKIFRKNSVSVYSDTGKEIHRGVNPESKIISEMEKALEFLNNDSIDYLLRIAVFHYLFGYIHPFYDGNGRTSRFISSYLLSRSLNRLIGYRISYTVKENIKKYYEAFKICNHPYNGGELTPFAEMFLEIVDISEKQLCEAMKKRVTLLDYYSSLIEKLPFGEKEDMWNLYHVLIQAALFSEAGISRKELEQYMKMSYNTLRSRLSLLPTELLTEARRERQIFYMLNLEKTDKYVN